MKSQRRDGRGHWPGGRRRSDMDVSRARDFVRRVRKALASGQHSRRSLGRLLRISPRTVSRWIAGEDRPMLRSSRYAQRLPR